MVQRFEGFFLRTELPVRAHRRGRHRRAHRLHRRAARGGHRRCTSCPSDGRRAGLAAVHRQGARWTSRPTGHRRRNAVLRFWRAHPRRADAQVSRSATSASPAGCRPRSTSTARAACGSPVPWYWNIAPNRDATLTPLLSPARPGAEAEFRYLDPASRPRRSTCCPTTRWLARALGALNLEPRGRLPLGASGTFNGLRVSDDALVEGLPARRAAASRRACCLRARRPSARLVSDGWSWPTRACTLAVLGRHSARAGAPPYRRSSSACSSGRGTLRFGDGFEFALETELNRFTDLPDAPPAAAPATPPAGAGMRWAAWRGPRRTPGLDGDAAVGQRRGLLARRAAGRRPAHDSRVIPDQCRPATGARGARRQLVRRDVRQTLSASRCT